MKRVAIAKLQNQFDKYLQLAKKEDVMITRNGKPAGMLIGFDSEDDWFEYRLIHDRRFQRRIEAANRSLRQGKGTRLEDLKV